MGLFESHVCDTRMCALSPRTQYYFFSLSLDHRTDCSRLFFPRLKKPIALFRPVILLRIPPFSFYYTTTSSSSCLPLSVFIPKLEARSHVT